MVNIKNVRISNASLKEKSPGMVALFVGGTSGVGKGTLEQLARYTDEPKVYIVGRSRSAASPLLEELKTINPNGTFTFMETEISLIKNVDKICSEIKEKEQKLDLIVLSTGFLTFAGKEETSEGIDLLASLDYYCRFRIVYNLLPLLTASTHPRVVSIFGGGKEQKIDTNDLEQKTTPYSTLKTIKNCTVQNTLAMEELAKTYPTITFCHVYPGFVNTGQMGRFMFTAKGIWKYPAMLARWTLVPVVSYFGRTVNMAGEWGLFIATSAKYPPAEPKDSADTGVPLPKGVQAAKSSLVKDGKGNGVYRLDQDGESVENEGDKFLADMRSDGAGKRVWEKTLEVWNRALHGAE